MSFNWHRPLPASRRHSGLTLNEGLAHFQSRASQEDCLAAAAAATTCQNNAEKGRKKFAIAAKSLGQTPCHDRGLPDFELSFHRLRREARPGGHNASSLTAVWSFYSNRFWPMFFQGRFAHASLCDRHRRFSFSIACLQLLRRATCNPGSLETRRIIRTFVRAV